MSRDQDPILEAFEEQYWKDRDAGTVRRLGEYLNLFPGADDAIAALFLSLQRGGRDTSSAEGEGWIGSYRILRELGRGAQGTVYLAEDTSLGRQVALKVLEGLGAAQGEAIARFRREALAASALQHPGICAVYEAKADARVPYIAMQYVEGETLARRIATTRDRLTPETERAVLTESQLRQPPEDDGSTTEVQSLDRGGILEVVHLMEKTSRALHAVHELKIVHRDIKPGNIMVTPGGEPVILDFGLARQEETDLAIMTRTGDLFGTPAYMSPEQLMGSRIRLDRRTDVYSLGVTLYECLSLRRPFEAPTREALYQAIMTKEPPDLQRFNRSISDDLRVVVATALEKDRDRRYQTALDLAEDLRRVREHEPITARSVGPLSRFVRWAQRNPVVAALTAALFLALTSGLVASFLLYTDAGAERDRANEKTAEASKNLDAYNRLADAGILEDLLREQEEDLWPAVPDKAKAMEEWLERARSLVKTLPEHEATLAELRTQALPYTDAAMAKDRASHKVEVEGLLVLEAERDEINHALDGLATSSLPEPWREKRKEELEVKLQEAEDKLSAERIRLEPVFSEPLTWEFDDPKLELRLQWRHDKLSDLVKGLESLRAAGSKGSGIAGMETRLETAKTLRRRTVEEHDSDWKACLMRVGKNSKYAPGTLSVPQLGLIPLGRDPVTTLEEFCETVTGDPPVRDPSTGKVEVKEMTSMVFVLLPGETFTMGAQAADPNGPNYDPKASVNESPLQDVTLAPFFLSKYEMTQGQWLRLMGVNPSYYQPDGGWGTDLRQPVEQVDWEDCRRAVHRLGLRLPTESQWEYGCRAGTRTVWSTGDDVGSLAGFVNIADEASQSRFVSGWQFEPGFKDGHPFTAPVGSLRPNDFGLHDMHGNVWEWCDDGFGPYRGRPDTGDGMRVVLGARNRVNRGGAFYFLAVFARSALRNVVAPSSRGGFSGVRAARSITP